MTTSIKCFLVASLVASFGLLSQAFADPVYQQTYDGLHSFLGSQNDTVGGGGNFATAYDNFTLGSSSAINNVMWVGGFWNGGSANITAFTISFWANNAGTPGGLLQSFHIAGNASQTAIGSGAYSYSLNLTSAFNAVAGTQYWLSIIPDVAYPPQWGWAGGTGGNNASIQDYFGIRYGRDHDRAFALNASAVTVPDSGNTAFLLGGSMAVLVLLWRRHHGAIIALTSPRLLIRG